MIFVCVSIARISNILKKVPLFGTTNSHKNLIYNKTLTNKNKTPSSPCSSSLFIDFGTTNSHKKLIYNETITMKKTIPSSPCSLSDWCSSLPVLLVLLVSASLSPVSVPLSALILALFSFVLVSAGRSGQRWRIWWDSWLVGASSEVEEVKWERGGGATLIPLSLRRRSDLWFIIFVRRKKKFFFSKLTLGGEQPNQPLSHFHSD